MTTDTGNTSPFSGIVEAAVIEAVLADLGSPTMMTAAQEAFRRRASGFSVDDTTLVAAFDALRGKLATLLTSAASAPEALPAQGALPFNLPEHMPEGTTHVIVRKKVLAFGRHDDQSGIMTLLAGSRIAPAWGASKSPYQEQHQRVVGQALAFVDPDDRTILAVDVDCSSATCAASIAVGASANVSVWRACPGVTDLEALPKTRKTPGVRLRLDQRDDIME
ncbi:DUF4357 domain-containing protein [Cereibacter sphaeroides]|uniref:DUF4357 domain-containing protein n=1 Tax=Cereibacter sphaeroides TaxID=1063 RepID=UPI001F3A01E7|nr:DUF4357 domain-containing protein [Cereibacter sphaeroides]MCE6958521.1 DUF4357 domain-containing protein [Cereibacter sphaeroides]MCE6972817.1 DUF4357 domain-containing protein [Cereibacter sphaeroides]